MKKSVLFLLLAFTVIFLSSCQSDRVAENNESLPRVSIIEAPEEIQTEHYGDDTDNSFDKQGSASSNVSNDIDINQGKTRSPIIKLEEIDKVYITPTGKKFHLSEKCAGKNCSLVTVGEALDLGLTPCGKCANTE